MGPASNFTQFVLVDNGGTGDVTVAPSNFANGIAEWISSNSRSQAYKVTCSVRQSSAQNRKYTIKVEVPKGAWRSYLNMELTIPIFATNSDCELIVKAMQGLLKDGNPIPSAIAANSGIYGSAAAAAMGTVGRLVVIVLFEGVDLLDVTGPPEVFSLARREAEDADGYEVVLAADSLDPVTTGAGVRVLPDLTFDEAARRSIDTLVVPGSVEVDGDRRVHALVDPVLVERVKELAGRSRRVASVCVGAHLLAAAGLLDGRRATTHWSTAPQLAAAHPEIDVDADPIFIREGDVWTGAGISACLDLSLALVADDLGEAVALRVARQLVMYLKRPSGQSQFSVPLEQISATRRIEDLRHHILRHLGRRLTVADLAAHAHVSDRHLTRIFRTELNTTPHAYIESVRVEKARNELESSDATLERIASVCGFGTVDTLVRAFRRRLDATPTEYRRRFRTSPTG